MKKICVLVCASVVAIAPPQRARQAIHHRKGSVQVHVDRGSADLAGWIDGRVRPRHREREGRQLRNVAVRGAGERVRQSRGGSPPVIATRRRAGRRTAGGSRSSARLRRTGKPQPGADLSAEHGRRRSARAHRRSSAVPSGPAWSPDGTNDCVHGSHRPRGQEGTSGAPTKSDVEVVTRAVYRANGNPSYVDIDHHSHIFTISILGSDPGLTPIRDSASARRS